MTTNKIIGTVEAVERERERASLLNEGIALKELNINKKIKAIMLIL